MTKVLQVQLESEKEISISEKKMRLIEQAETLEIQTDEQCEFALDLIKALKAGHDNAEDERVKLVKPMNDAVKSLNARFKQYTEPFKTAEKVVRQKVLGYQQFKEALRKEEEAKQAAAEKKARDEEAARNAIEQQNAVAATSTLEGGETPPSVEEMGQGDDVAPVDRSQPAPDHHVLQPHDLIIQGPKSEPVRMRSEGGSVATVRKKWAYRVIDIVELAKTNPSAVQPNHAGIMHCIKEGVRFMPGLEIYEEDVLQVR